MSCIFKLLRSVFPEKNLHHKKCSSNEINGVCVELTTLCFIFWLIYIIQSRIHLQNIHRVAEKQHMTKHFLAKGSYPYQQGRSLVFGVKHS